MADIPVHADLFRIDPEREMNAQSGLMELDGEFQAEFIPDPLASVPLDVLATVDDPGFFDRIEAVPHAPALSSELKSI